MFGWSWFGFLFSVLNNTQVLQYNPSCAKPHTKSVGGGGAHWWHPPLDPPMVALALVILALAFSFATLRAGDIFFMLTGAHLLPVFLAAQGTFLHGCFPPSSRVAVGPVVPEVLGLTSSVRIANLALGSLDGSSARLGICLVLAIYNTDFLFTNSSTCHPQPNTMSHSIHTASSLFALRAWCNLSFSTSWTTIFHCFCISADTCVQGVGYLTLIPRVFTVPT